ncbi:hypothetical protein DCO16_04830 [Polynucleobacter antarcticus]|uniref:Uncharacterized protein n=1 Tax=Polynucleobacter antarcticus TaxID=1743162 RepID=A0A6M9PUL0_9BURK|nr:hypothetical protein DCO16_04830 [Polynucleobacter antarcticus]
MMQLQKKLPILILLLAISLSIPPLRAYIEQSMAIHMLVQMPLLLLSGYFVYPSIQARSSKFKSLGHYDFWGLTSFFTFFLILTFWSLPISIDLAIIKVEVDFLKVLSLFLAGVLLRSSLSRAPFVLPLFFFTYLLAMFIWMGIYLQSTSQRVCNAYSLESQVRTGYGLIIISTLLFTGWLAYLYFSNMRDNSVNHKLH